MALLVPGVGENKLLEFALGKSTPGTQKLRLYVNDVTPADGDTAGTYTQMSTHGYVEQMLTNSSWTIAQNGANAAEGSYPQVTWNFTAAAAVTVYGYYVVDTTTGVLLWAERFSTPQVVQFNGDQIRVTPKITLSRV